MSRLIKPGGEMIFSHRKRETILFFSILFLFLAISVTCAFTATKTIRIKMDSKVEHLGGPCYSYSVKARLMTTVEEVLEQEQIRLNDNQELSCSTDTRIKDIDEIIITNKVKGIIKVDGNEIPFNSAAKDVEALLKEKHIALKTHDQVSPSLHALITADQNVITITRITYSIEGNYRDIPFESVSQEDEELELGTENIQVAGVNGLETVLERVTYRDGVAAERTVIIQKVLKEPVNEVKIIGTKNPHGGSTGNATAEIGDDFEFICAVVAQEGGYSYEGALGVISCIMNRADNSGTDAISVITAPGQFSAYGSGAYLSRIGTDMPEVEQAVKDCMEGGIRNTDATSFRGYEVDGATQIGGNYFF